MRRDKEAGDKKGKGVDTVWPLCIQEGSRCPLSLPLSHEALHLSTFCCTNRRYVATP